LAAMPERVTELEKRVDSMDEGLRAHFVESHAALVAAVATVDARIDRFEAYVRTAFEVVDGRLAHLETRLERLDVRLDRVEARLDRVEARLDRIEARLDRIEAKLDQVDVRLNGLDAKLDAVIRGLEELRLAGARRGQRRRN
jgi:chromosome segregation ATPase